MFALIQLFLLKKHFIDENIIWIYYEVVTSCFILINQNFLQVIIVIWTLNTGNTIGHSLQIFSFRERFYKKIGLKGKLNPINIYINFQ